MNKQEPIAWAVIDSKGNLVELAKTRLALEHDHIRQDDQIKKLYLSESPESPTLTKEEIETIYDLLGDVSDITGPAEDTIRNLLQRIKND